MTALVMGDGAYSRGLADILKEEQVFTQVTLCQSAGAVPYSAKGAYVIARPVSYTHLDVYKRQTSPCAGPC